MVFYGSLIGNRHDDLRLISFYDVYTVRVQCPSYTLWSLVNIHSQVYPWPWCMMICKWSRDTGFRNKYTLPTPLATPLMQVHVLYKSPMPNVPVVSWAEKHFFLNVSLTVTSVYHRQNLAYDSHHNLE